MRKLLCEDCQHIWTEGDGYNGFRRVEGRALPPKPEQRRVTMAALRPDGTTVPGSAKVVSTLPTHHYDCDNCNAPIFPGQRIYAVSAWPRCYAEMAPWEHEFLTR